MIKKQTNDNKNPKTQLYFFWLLFLAVTIVCFLIFMPYIGMLVLALSLAVAVEPWHKAILKFVGGHKGIASLLTIVVIGLVILTPLTFIGLQVFNESKNLYDYFSANQSTVIHTITNYLHTWLPNVQLDADTYIKQFSGNVASTLATIFSTTLATLLEIVLALVALFFFLRDGETFLKSLIVASPLEDKYDDIIINKLKGAINGVVRGSLLLGVIQGIVASVGFTIFGVPNSMLWGSVAAICSFVPTVGTSLVTIPAVAYLFITGNTVGGIGLAIWVLVAVGLVDNLLAPFVMGRETKLHPLFLLFGILGGLSLFGPIGILLGPLALSLFFALVDVYRILIERK